MEDVALKDIFKNNLVISNTKDIKIYKFFFKNKEYEIITDKFYPNSLPIIDGLDTNKFKNYIGKPMIYLLLLECIKKNENNFDTQEEFISTLNFQTIDKITEEQFYKLKLKKNKIKQKKEGLSGRDLFLKNL